jgi:malonyl-CoA/methylmalonyl-CoA synthetase
MEENRICCGIQGHNAQQLLALHMLTIFHVHGLFFALHCTLLSGANMYFLPKFDIDLAIKYLPKSTVMMGIPTYYTRLLDNKNFQKPICGNMRLFVSGSAPLLEQTFNEFKHRTGFTILERYGMTETGINTSNPLNSQRLPGTVGFPLPESSLRIVDDEDNSVAPGVPGHIQVKGGNVFNGYWRKPEKTDESFTSDQFFRTGDLGEINNNGYISIVGRAKDMIISGGLNVYPKEIEACINSIDGVIESAVVGLPHKDFGEAVTAAVVKRSNSKLTRPKIYEILKEQLANFKLPKNIIFIDTLPKNTMGKIEKNKLKNQINATSENLGQARIDV